MSAETMHADEVGIDVSVVRRLLAAQFPQWADLPIEPVASAGTDNAIYRLGEDMAVRLPRIPRATGQVDKEQRWLPRLAPHHGDLFPGNLLARQGRLSAVIDFGGLGVGDPACDLIPAWNLFSGQARDVFRAALPADDATWARGRGWALSIALIALPYYQHTNPVIVADASHTIDEVLAES